eukprot:698894-Prorocentrum_minimum.AAC.1
MAGELQGGDPTLAGGERPRAGGVAPPQRRGGPPRHLAVREGGGWALQLPRAAERPNLPLPVRVPHNTHLPIVR